MKWSYGVTPPLADVKSYESCIVRLKMNVGDFTFEKNPSGKYHYFSGKTDEDFLYYQRPFLFGTDLCLAVNGLLTGQPSLYVNKPYYKFINHRFMNLHSPGYILTDIASLMLLRHNFSPLHCSAFRYKDATVVIFAPPNTGKTLSTMMACIELGASFIAEDLAITDGKTIFSVPWTSTFRYYDNIDNNHQVKLINSLTRKIPLLELVSFVKPKPINNYLRDPKQILASSKATHIVILERDMDDSIQPIHFDEAFRKIINLNKYEFKYDKAPTTIAYEFFNPSLDLKMAVQSEEKILATLIKAANNVFVVKSPDATKYISLILKAIGLPE